MNERFCLEVGMTFVALAFASALPAGATRHGAGTAELEAAPEGVSE